MTENLNGNRSNCLQCGLQKICFPKGLFRSDVERLEQVVDKMPTLDRGEILFKAGDKFKSLYAIKAGMVKIYSINDNDEEIIHGFYLPGDVVGSEALADKVHLFNAVAQDVTSVCSIEMEQLQDLSKMVPNLYTHILAIMSRDIVDGRIHNELLTKKSADQRVAYFLWTMVERYQLRGYQYTQFRLNILHKEVASFLNLTPETVSRVMAKMAKDDILSWKKKEVNVLNIDRLKNLAL
ncbi:cyclic nucleotide-binding domain-containing protein [Thiosulfativibrio zosterae]|uniref:Transcriptional regulator FNR n=1 Tax=Thiosulfativibrio zosterae TaxID=2675053 RepID=A0A6F8PPG3_9GAMM|nr:cyclic nucleotide-binding domain-containing protein [Thiosulfativibrio zosterae]BBP43995.1 transcriptional regulator FNR [Thiosulfativibrio zosterae]